MIQIELPKGFEDRLMAIATKRGLTKETCARKFVIKLIVDMEDTDRCVEILKESDGKTYTTEELKAELGLEN